MPGFAGDNPGRHRSAFPHPSNLLAWDSEICCAWQGDAQQEGSDAMPMRRTIGISLACLVTSACAIAKAPQESTPHYPEESTDVTPGNEVPIDRSRSFTGGTAAERRSVDHGAEGVEQRRTNFEPVANVCGSAPGPRCSPVRSAGRRQFGKAAWYDFVGKETASGELLDTITATAAHRSLPLASYANVTNLDNGRSVIVKINDRGPYTRGRIIDLSPRAADALDMKRAGVAAVVIEPLVDQAAPTVVVSQTSGTVVAQ
jgi:rare lipoprotein A